MKDKRALGTRKPFGQIGYRHEVAVERVLCGPFGNRVIFNGGRIKKKPPFGGFLDLRTHR
jgi:hypothetical protein